MEAMMSIELLDKTRKINRLLTDQRSSKVAFKDICEVLGGILEANAYVISVKGKFLGTYTLESLNPIITTKNKGTYIDSKLNERLLSILSTNENVNLEMLGFSKELIGDYKALVTPISVSGDRLGTLFLYRDSESFCIEDIILSEYSTTVVGLEMLRAIQEETEKEANKVKRVSFALAALTPLEQKAAAQVFHELDDEEGILVTSKLANKSGITRTVIVNALKKLESAGLIRTKSSGVKGTFIKILNEKVFAEFSSYYNEKGNS